MKRNQTKAIWAKKYNKGTIKIIKKDNNDFRVIDTNSPSMSFGNLEFAKDYAERHYRTMLYRFPKANRRG